MKVIAVGAGRVGSRHLCRLYGENFKKYVQATHDTEGWSPKVFGEAWDLGFDHPKVIGAAVWRWTNLGQSRNKAGSWIECSAFSVPYIYGMCKHDPELEVLVQVREPEGFVRSCLDLDIRGLGPMLPGNHYPDRWHTGRQTPTKSIRGYNVDYPQYYYDIYTGIRAQLEKLHKEPIHVFDLGEYSKGVYVTELLELFEIPRSDENLKTVQEICGHKDNAVSQYGSFSGDYSYEGELPDMEYCWDIYTQWRSLC